MTDKKSTPTATRARVSGSTPFSMTFRQTPSRDQHQIFVGEGHEEAAVKYIDELLANGGEAFILQPVRAFTAPKRPVATEIKLGESNDE